MMVISPVVCMFVGLASATADTGAPKPTHVAVSMDVLGVVELGPSLELDVTLHRDLAGRPRVVAARGAS